MAVDAFLQLGDLKGEAQVDDFKDQIQVLSWSWGMSQTGTTHMGSGGGAGKVNVQDLSITHYIDTASANIVKACCSGKHFEEAVLTLRKAGEDPLEYLTVKLENCIVTSYSMGGSEGEERNTASFTINFAAFTFSYQPQDNKGAKAGGSIEYQANIAKAKFN